MLATKVLSPAHDCEILKAKSNKVQASGKFLDAGDQKLDLGG
jgi:hypothetical protein